MFFLFDISSHSIHVCLILKNIHSDLLPPPFNLIVLVLAFVWYLVEIPLVACKVGVTLIGTVDFFEYQYSFMKTIKALIYGQNTVWICSYCHCTNSTTMSKTEKMADLDEWMERTGMDPKDRRKMYICGASICSYCRRIKRPIKRLWYIADNISYIFAYSIILPIYCTFLAPLKFIKSLFVEFSDIQGDDEGEFYQILFEKQVYCIRFALGQSLRE